MLLARQSICGVFLVNACYLYCSVASFSRQHLSVLCPQESSLYVITKKKEFVIVYDYR